MAEIPVIVAGFLGPAIELGKCIAEPIKRQVNYLCCFNNNVQNLQNESRKLEEARFGLQSKVDIAQNNAEIVAPHVLSWLAKVSEIRTNMPVIDGEITTTRNSGRCTVGSRYSLSKKVKKMAEEMIELRQESDNLTTIAHPPPPAAMASIRLRSTFEFDSRKRVEEEVMVSLRDEKTFMVGICGMGGVGKTTMANTIMHRARKELGFEETVMVVISQVVDKLKIQDDIANSLGLTLKGRTLSCNAEALHKRLSAGTRRSLVVIDDVWGKLELEELGIPCNISGCRVLITSRNRHLLEAMDVEKLHAVHVLSKTEPWELFKSKAGSCIEQQNVVAVAKKVVDECKGLPLALVTVGLALKDMADIYSWNTALRQLKSSNPKHMPEVINSVYRPLKLSYDLLETEEQKTLFLLCCLFPEDDDIPVETLANICMGLLQLNEDITSSRDTTSFLIDKLKSRFLLLDSRHTNHVKMHDVVRDVAIFIAAEEKRIKCNECTWISPNIGERIGAHGGSSLFPNLRLLWIDDDSRDKELEIHEDFLEGKSNLKVIMIECWSLQQLPETIGLLKNLRTLVLRDCESLESISVVGELVNLEIFVCRECETIESLPVETGRLSQLRLLELSGCWNLKTIAPGIISNLIKLEELIVEEFDGWEARIVEGERKNASLFELEHLSSLTNLKIVVRDNGLAAENFRLSPNLLKFDITVGNGECFYPISTCEKTMRLELPRDINLGKWIHECVRNVESLRLRGDGSKSVLDLPVVALNLKELDISDCSTVKNLVNTQYFHQLEHLSLQKLCELEEICDISNLKKLSSINIEGCGRLRNLFSLSVMESGGCFLQLEKLKIRQCEMMEQVLMWNEEEENQTNIHIPLLLFPKLKLIKLDTLPSLTSFIKGIESIEFPQLDKIDINHCPLLKEFVCNGSPADHHGDDNDFIHLSFDHLHKVKFGKLSKLQVKWVRNLCLQAPIDSFTSLSELVVYGLQGVKNLFSFSMAESGCLSQLIRLEIGRCEMMEQVLMWNEEEQNQTNIHIPLLLFPKLKLIKLYVLPSLTSFIKGIQGIEFPELDEMSIGECPLLKEFVCSGSPAEHHGDDNDFMLSCDPHKAKFGKLSNLQISGVKNLCLQAPIDSFTSLSELVVYGLEGLKNLFSFSMAESGCLSQLIRLEIGTCEMMEQVLMWNEEEHNQTNIHIPLLLFPKLKLIKLDNLPSLTSFIKGIESIEFPQLAETFIEKCPLLKEFVCSGSPADHHGDDNDPLHFSCDHPHKAKFGKLSELRICWVKNLCLQAPIDSFSSLSQLHVSGLKGVKSLFSFSITESSCLSQLERLIIRHCDMMEQVILWKEEENQMDIHITLFPKLKILNLSYLPRLTSLSKGIENIQFHLPDTMEINNCPLLESCASEIADQNDDYSHLFCKPHHKVEFDRLKELDIRGNIYDGMRRNWCPQIPMIDLFAGLCKLDVFRLDDMESLFPCSIARMMQHIKTLQISYCREMVRVIEDDAEFETQTQTTPVLLFPNLEVLYLTRLPKLRSLCEWRCSLQLSSLLNLEICGCDVMEELTSGPLHTPNLQKLKIDHHDFNDKDVKTALHSKRGGTQNLIGGEQGGGDLAN